MILCCGEALIDMVETSMGDQGHGFKSISGGAIFNTAIALGRLAVPVGLMSGISTDLFGEQLVDDLHASKVDSRYLIRSARPTTLAFVKITNGQARYTFYDENSAGRMITSADAKVLTDEIAAYYFGGISLCAEPAASAYEQYAMQAAANAVVMLDPNIRPSFISDETAYRARLQRIFAVADIIKVSDEDLHWLIPSQSSLEAKAAALQQHGASIVVVTEGSKGAGAYVGGIEIARVGTPKVCVVDTVGAGDTFNAGFLAYLQGEGLLTKNRLTNASASDLSAALAKGAQVAAVTVSRAGANPPWFEELVS